MPTINPRCKLPLAKALATLSFTSILFLMSSAASACLESYVSVPLHFTGNVSSGKSFKTEITQNYYFAENLFGFQVKVATPPDIPIYFRLIPNDRGWQMQIGPTDNLTPDYITIASPPDISTTIQNLDGNFSQATQQILTRSFCFNMNPADYQTALRELIQNFKNGMLDIFRRECAAEDDGIGRGIISILSASSAERKFAVDLKIPVYHTDCSPP